MDLQGLRVLMCHNRYLIRGGEDTATDSEIELLRGAGVEVELLEISNEEIAQRGAIRTAADTVWSRSSYKLIQDRLAAFKPHLVHIQNFFPLLSPSICHAASRAGVPVVMTLHNYRLGCLNALLYRDERVCEDCLGRTIPWPGVLHACYRDDRRASAAVAAMLVTHRALRTWHRTVSMFVTSSDFARRKLIQAGIPPEKLAVKPNFVHPDPGVGTGGGGYALMAGRLTTQKGVHTVLKAWRSIAFPLILVGEGPLEAAVRRSGPNVQLLGALPRAEVLALMKEASFVVMAPASYEVLPLVPLESFACGTPVLAGRMGALTDLITEGETGRLVAPDNPVALASAARDLAADPNLAQMRLSARRAYESQFSASQNLATISAIYARALITPDPRSGQVGDAGPAVE